MPGCRKSLDALKLETGENASLIMDRYVKNLDDKNESKRKLFSAMPHAVSHAKDLYSHAFRVRHDTLSAVAVSKIFIATQPLAAGRFYDAWILPESVSECFVVDVMTPHHGNDFAAPTPINFLTVKGEFEIFIGCSDFESDKKWIEFSFSLVEEALSSCGIGGKIRAGYGKMNRVI